MNPAKLHNHAQFISLLFTAAGSSYFPVMQSHEYPPDAYQYKIFNGRSKLSNPIRKSFPSQINKSTIVNFFEEYTLNKNLLVLMSKFGIKDSTNEINKNEFFLALAAQFIEYVQKPIDAVDQIVISEFLNLIRNGNSQNNDDNMDSRPLTTSVLGQPENVLPEIYNYFLKVKNASRRLTHFYENPEDRGYGTTFSVRNNLDKKPYPSLLSLCNDINNDVRLVFLEAKGGYGKSYAMIRLYHDLVCTDNGIDTVFISARKIKKPNECDYPIANFFVENIMCTEHKHSSPCDGCDYIFGNNKRLLTNQLNLA